MQWEEHFSGMLQVLSLLLLRMIAEREWLMAVVCSGVYCVVMCVEGSLKQLVRILKVKVHRESISWSQLSNKLISSKYKLFLQV